MVCWQKKGARGGSSARSPLLVYFCVGIARYLWRGGGHFLLIRRCVTGFCAHKKKQLIVLFESWPMNEAMEASRWLTRRRRCAQTGAPGLHRRFVLHPTCLSEANITLFVRLSAPVPCAAALLDRSSLGDHFLPVSDHVLGRWMSVGVQVFRGCRVVLGGAVSGLG